MIHHLHETPNGGHTLPGVRSGTVKAGGASNSNASDRRATPDGYSIGHGNGTDNGVHGSNSKLAPLVVDRSLAGWLQRLPLAGRQQWSAGWLDTTISWLPSPGMNPDPLID